MVERLASRMPTDIAIPQPVIAEIAYGIERLPRSRRRSLLRARFDLICSDVPRAEWTDAVSHAFGRVKGILERRGTRIEDFDAAIAAHALATGATSSQRMQTTRLIRGVHHPTPSIVTIVPRADRMPRWLSTPPAMTDLFVCDSALSSHRSNVTRVRCKAEVGLSISSSAVPLRRFAPSWSTPRAATGP
jgi:predicted nucleic acid-binding protein